MSRVIPKPTSHLETLQPYEEALAIPLSERLESPVLKLDCNEATYPPSPLVKKRLIEFIEGQPLNWYPDTQAQDLRRALTRYVGYSPECIATFNGCDHALETLCQAYVEKGDEVVIFSPTYDNFRVFAENAGGVIVPIFAKSPFETNVEGLKEVLSPKAKIVYLANPTNPTGVTYSKNEIQFILETSSSSLVIVDEAYFEFWGETSLPLIKNYPNLVVTRSFSKAFGLAALRCGYIVSDPRNIDAINKIRNGKSINALAQVAAEAALEDLSYIQTQIQKIRESKSWLLRELQEMGIFAIDTPANFVLIQASSPEAVEKALQSENVLVRNRSQITQLEGFLRVTVGMKAEMEQLLGVLAAMNEEFFTEKRHQTVAV